MKAKQPLTRWCGALLAMMSAADACETTSGSRGGTNYAMRVRSGEGCTLSLYTGSGVMSGVTRNVSFRVVARPRNGRAGTEGTSAIAYQAKSGFTGRDDFSVEVIREANGAQTRSIYAVSVDVYQ